MQSLGHIHRKSTTEKLQSWVCCVLYSNCWRWLLKGGILWYMFRQVPLNDTIAIMCYYSSPVSTYQCSEMTYHNGPLIRLYKTFTYLQYKTCLTTTTRTHFTKTTFPSTFRTPRSLYPLQLCPPPQLNRRYYFPMAGLFPFPWPSISF